MKIDKVNWLQCKNCNILINNLDCYPSNLFFDRGIAMGSAVVECPKCLYNDVIECRIEATFSSIVSKGIPDDKAYLEMLIEQRKEKD